MMATARRRYRCKRVGFTKQFANSRYRHIWQYAYILTGTTVYKVIFTYRYTVGTIKPLLNRGALFPANALTAGRVWAK